MEDILLDTTDRTIPVWIADPASTTGAGKTGLAAAAVTITYTRYEVDNDVVHTDVTSSVNDLSALTDAHNDWGWKEVSSTLSKGLYRLDVADAVFATGAWYAVVQVTITSGTAAATPKAFRLVARNDLDGVRLGLTALPNAAAAAAGGLIIIGSNNTAAITVGAVTTGAIACTTITASGAVAFQSTFAVTTSTSLAALSCSTFAASGTVTYNAFTITNALTVSGATTLTGAISATNAGNSITGISLAATGLDAVVPADPGTTLPSFAGNATIVQWIGWFGAVSVNKVTSDGTDAIVRNTADNADLATFALSDNGTTFTSGSAS